jgi:hypothetical protein
MLDLDIPEGFPATVVEHAGLSFADFLESKYGQKILKISPDVREAIALDYIKGIYAGPFIKVTVSPSAPQEWRERVKIEWTWTTIVEEDS